MNLGFKKLDVLFEEQNESKGLVYFSPLERGYARTLGNDLRRVMLSSIPGTSVVGVKISGTNHEFCRIEGTVSTGTEIVFNLKQMKFDFDSEDMLYAEFKTNKAGTYNAKDFKLPKGVVCLTPNQELVKLTGEKEVTIGIYLRRGRGYVDAEMHVFLEDESFVDVIRIDGTFSPINNVSVEVQNIRVGQNTEFEKLILTVETDGTISPKSSVTLASEIIRTMLSFTQDMKEYVEEFEMIEEEKEKENLILDMTIEELGLSVRPYNCLKAANYDSVGKILSLTRSQLGAIEQLGAKSIREIEEKITELGYKLKEE